MIRSFYRDCKGSISVMWAILLPMIVGTVGLGVDTGVWYVNARNTQMAVDAAALSAAQEMGSGATQATMLTLVTAELARNGISTADGTTITVNYPPTSGSQSGSSSALEVIVTRPQNRFFSVLALGNAPTTQARSVAMQQSSGSGSACILALNNSSSNAVNINGNVNMNMNTCAIASNSSNTSAMRLNGNITINAYQLYSAGGIRKNGNIHVNTAAADVTYGATLNDPYSNVSVPSFSGCDYNNKSLNGNFGTVTLSEGVYCNGLNINGNGTVNLNPGIYIMDRGSFSTNGNTNILGTGVTIILTSSTGSNHATLSTNGNTAMNLTAQTSADTTGSITGDYSGMLFYRDRNASSENISFNGNANLHLQGALYFPNDTYTHNGNAGSSNCSQLVANIINMNGNADFTSNCPGTGMSPIPLGDSTIRLAE